MMMVGSVLCTASPTAALTLELPAPVLAEEGRTELPGSYALPTGPHDGTTLPVAVVEGAIDQRAYQLDAAGATTLSILAPLRDQILAAGFTSVLECEDRACGGFDFRFDTEIMPEPDMHVDLGDFRFLSARRGDEAISILVSRSALSAYVQITRVTDAPEAGQAPAVAEDAAVIDLDEPVMRGFSAVSAAPGIAAALDTAGTATLDDLVFSSGSASLAAGDYPSLAAVADWLEANPDSTIALVGHTDASGSLAANIALSDRRAEEAASVLIDRYGADPDRITAEGVGFLAPRASNQTEEGRQKNRRVEVIVTTTR